MEEEEQKEEEEREEEALEEGGVRRVYFRTMAWMLCSNAGECARTSG